MIATPKIATPEIATPMDGRTSLSLQIGYASTGRRMNVRAPAIAGRAATSCNPQPNYAPLCIAGRAASGAGSMAGASTILRISAAVLLKTVALVQ
jgi:hypothetical protein